MLEGVDVDELVIWVVDVFEHLVQATRLNV